jgi:hypothetical protein
VNNRSATGNLAILLWQIETQRNSIAGFQMDWTAEADSAAAYVAADTADQCPR